VALNLQWKHFLHKDTCTKYYVYYPFNGNLLHQFDVNYIFTHGFYFSYTGIFIGAVRAPENPGQTFTPVQFVNGNEFMLLFKPDPNEDIVLAVRTKGCGTYIVLFIILPQTYWFKVFRWVRNCIKDIILSLWYLFPARRGRCVFKISENKLFCVNHYTQLDDITKSSERQSTHPVELVGEKYECCVNLAVNAFTE